MKSLKNLYCDNITEQCIGILRIWIKQYLERNDLELLEINWKDRYVACYKKDCNNPFEDYFTFDYTKKNLF